MNEKDRKLYLELRRGLLIVVRALGNYCGIAEEWPPKSGPSREKTPVVSGGTAERRSNTQEHVM